MAGGRPTKYKPQYCKEIIEFMSKGNSLVQFAAKIEVSKDTIYQWTKDHTVFSDAFEIARLKCEDYWEKVVKEKATTKSPGNPGVLMFYMKNRFRWSEGKDKEEKEEEKQGAQVIITLPDNGRARKEEP